MKNNLPKWVREKGEILQEVSQDISKYGSKLLDKAKKIDINKVPVFKDRNLEWLQKSKAEIPMNVYTLNAWEEEQELREKLDNAIHRAYYKEGGFRYFGSNLVWYVKKALPFQTDGEMIWAAGYNSCIHPMLRQLEKLEIEMNELWTDSNREKIKLKNAALLEKMQKFRELAYEEKLHMETELDQEAYRQALCNYTAKLEAQLLIPFRFETDQ